MLVFFLALELSSIVHIFQALRAKFNLDFVDPDRVKIFFSVLHSKRLQTSRQSQAISSRTTVRRMSVAAESKWESEIKHPFRQEEEEEISDDEKEEENDDDLFDSAIEATQRDELLQSVKAIFSDDESSRQ
jgi:ribosomal protein L12E/L44/L45/RPP1/RPP2